MSVLALLHLLEVACCHAVIIYRIGYSHTYDVMSAGADVPVEDASFWHGGGFQLRKGTDGSIVCPSFLRPLVGDILSAGKSVLLLRAKQLQSSRCATLSSEKMLLSHRIGVHS